MHTKSSVNICSFYNYCKIDVYISVVGTTRCSLRDAGSAKDWRVQGKCGMGWGGVSCAPGRPLCTNGVGGWERQFFQV